MERISLNSAAFRCLVQKGLMLENTYYPWELEQAIGRWVQYHNHARYHESLDNVTPSDVYHGHGKEILDQRAIIKSRTMNQRKAKT